LAGAQTASLRKALVWLGRAQLRLVSLWSHWFLGRGKPVFGYSNTSESFESRMRKQLGVRHAELGIEGFHLPDNLMIVGAVHSGGYPIFVPRDGEARGIDALDVFITCAEAAGRSVAKRGER
jgi:hypothetical protein